MPHLAGGCVFILCIVFLFDVIFGFCVFIFSRGLQDTVSQLLPYRLSWTCFCYHIVWGGTYFFILMAMWSGLSTLTSRLKQWVFH